jgi:hypothetical protein
MPSSYRQIVDRRIFSLWLDYIYQSEPLLGKFAGPDYRAIIARFENLDRDFPLATGERFRCSCFTHTRHRRRSAPVPADWES